LFALGPHLALVLPSLGFCALLPGLARFQKLFSLLSDKCNLIQHIAGVSTFHHLSVLAVAATCGRERSENNKKKTNNRAGVSHGSPWRCHS
jgi:hypothetical protein